MFSSHRCFQYYLLLIVILGTYRLLIVGTSQPGWFAATVFTVVLLLATAIVRHQLVGLIEVGPIVARQQRHFLSEFAIYFSVAVGILLADVLWLAQPAPSVLRYAALVLAFGFLASIDSTLARIPHWLEIKDRPFAGKYNMQPTTWRLAVLPGSIVIALTGLLCLAAYALADSLRMSAPAMHLVLFRNFLTDVAFTLLVIGGISLLIIRRYVFNLKSQVDRQVEVLKNIQTGDYTGEVPIISHDSFGLLASQINRVTDYLRERDRIHDVLKRLVSPSIMKKLVSTDSAALKKGHESDLAILFCDIRGFTRASEASSAQDMILFLNSYFADLSELVSAHNGIINKFLGDGLLAVYGIDGPEEAVTNAFNTATDVVGHSEGFTLPDGSIPEVGIGIHYGTVIAGTIGSAQRYEYTFLGDTVNTASRLEGLSKRLGYKIIISADAYKMLAEEHRKRLNDLGDHRVRGKSEAVPVYGAEKQRPPR